MIGAIKPTLQELVNDTIRPARMTQYSLPKPLHSLQTAQQEGQVQAREEWLPNEGKRR